MELDGYKTSNIKFSSNFNLLLKNESNNNIKNF
jgi:hypothetical protein